MGIYTSNFDFNKYRAFYAVAECKSFSKATELLHVSQPSISRSVKELENELETKLFIRENKTVKLTENGEKLLSYVQKAFNTIIMAERALTEDKQDLTGEVRIGIYSHLSLFMLPKLIKEFQQLHPNVSFDIYSSSTAESTLKLKNRELDFIILQYPIYTENDEYSEEIICELDNCFFASKKYYDLYTSEQKEVIEYPLLLPTRGYEDINKLEKLFKKKNMILKTNLRVYAIETTKRLVEQDLGIGWGLKKSVEEELNNKVLYEIPISFMNPRTKFSIAYNEVLLDRTAQEFLKYAREYFKKEFN